jgi:hypothetical protein
MEKQKTGTDEGRTITILPIDLKGILVTVKSLDGSTYIPHRLGVETMQGIEDKVTGKAVKGKKNRNFDAEYESCFYKTGEGSYGIPASAFAACILDAAVAVNIPKTQIKRAVRVLGDVYELTYKKVNRRVDYPRQSGMTKAPDIRHRPEFIDWECTLHIQYDANQITPDQVFNLVNQAGFSSGVGDWRPSAPKSSGTHGMFEIKLTEEKK